MIQLVKKLLLKIIDDIDAGNCNITEEDTIKLIDSLKRITSKDEGMSKYSACQYLNISRATFDNHVREGNVPRGKHIIGFKELRWYKKDLDSFINTCKR